MNPYVKSARPPHYRKKGGLYNLIITGNSISICDGYFTVPQSRTYTKILSDHKIRIKVPERLRGKKIREVDCLKKTARYIINFCIANDIGTIICGYNPDCKRGINLGKKINQQFTQIPFGTLRRQLENLCARYGMKYIEQEESYTSKASFLDLDF